jgi:hypothetical protein
MPPSNPAGRAEFFPEPCGGVVQTVVSPGEHQPVYTPCTSELLFAPFLRNMRPLFSITCVFSIGLRSSTPRLHHYYKINYQ